MHRPTPKRKFGSSTRRKIDVKIIQEKHNYTKNDLKKIKLFNTLSIFMAGLLAVELTTTLLHSDR
jgi:hypothetical protein